MCALEPNTRAVHSFLMTELGQRRRDMAVDGPHRQHQSICELSVGQTWPSSSSCRLTGSSKLAGYLREGGGAAGIQSVA